MNVQLHSDDIQALWLSLQLATTVTLILLVVGVPLSWWLAHSRSRISGVIETTVTLPLVLPPSVIGFYALLAIAPEGIVGRGAKVLGIDQLAFTFGGLVLASVFYSLPFMVSPIQNAFAARGKRSLEVAATLRASPFVAFWSIALPAARNGIATGIAMTFAHTMGEFGLVLMIGGSIPEVTRVASVQVFEHVESLNTARAHGLALALLIIAIVTSLLLRILARKAALGAPQNAAPQKE